MGEVGPGAADDGRAAGLCSPSAVEGERRPGQRAPTREQHVERKNGVSTSRRSSEQYDVKDEARLTYNLQ